MSQESQLILAFLGILVAIAVPVLLWIVNSHIKMRDDLIRQEERIKRLAVATRAIERMMEEVGNRTIIASVLDEFDA